MIATCVFVHLFGCYRVESIHLYVQSVECNLTESIRKMSGRTFRGIARTVIRYKAYL